MQWPKEPKNINEEFEQNVKNMGLPKRKTNEDPADDVIEVSRKHFKGGSDGKEIKNA